MTKTHGFGGRINRNSTYRAWESMIRRCHVSSDKSFKNYGGRGILVYDEWRGNFAAFYAYVGERPLGMTIDRTDNSLGYFPGNVRWATRKEQAANRRSSIRMIIDGKDLCFSEHCRMAGLSYATVMARIKRHKWSLDRALNTPIKRPMP